MRKYKKLCASNFFSSIQEPVDTIFQIITPANKDAPAIGENDNLSQSAISNSSYRSNMQGLGGNHSPAEYDEFSRISEIDETLQINENKGDFLSGKAKKFMV
jgi:hypothetical protein